MVATRTATSIDTLQSNIKHLIYLTNDKMKLYVQVICLVVSVVADVSHLKQSGYVYNVPSPAFELPSAPVKEYLPPLSPAPVEEEILPDVIVPKSTYLPPVEVPSPTIPVAPTNNYLPPAEPISEVEEIASEPIVEPVKEYLPPSVAPVVPTTAYLPPSVAPTVDYQSAVETGGYRYDPPLTKFRF